MKVKIIVYIVIISLIGLSGCQLRESKEKKTSAQEEVVAVKVMKVELKDIAEVIDYVGNIKAQDEAVIYPKVTGKIVEKIKEDGNEVKKGEPIAYIDRDEVGLQFQHAPVESSLDGVIGRIYVDKGQNVSPQSPVALVVNMDRMKVNLQIPERYLSKISLKQKAGIRVDAYPGEEFLGEISKISPIVDLDTRSAPIEIILDNPDHRLKPGMFARVSIAIEKHTQVPVILKEAILGKEPDTYVYVVEDKKAILRKVVLGLRQGPVCEVKEGLNPGELVVVMGQQRLQQGTLVQIEE